MSHYDWNQLPAEQLSPKISRKVIHTKSMTIARLEIKKDAVVPEHSHVNEQVSMIETGALLFVMNGSKQVVRAGECLAIPPREPHRVEALEDSVAVDVFSPAREDWIRGDDAYLRR